MISHIKEGGNGVYSSSDDNNGLGEWVNYQNASYEAIQMAKWVKWGQGQVSKPLGEP